jgi:hypothetical protein
LLFGPPVLIDSALAELVGPTVLLGESLRVFHQAIRPSLADNFHEIDATDLQRVIDEFLELVRPTNGQMALEKDAIKT